MDKALKQPTTPIGHTQTDKTSNKNKHSLATLITDSGDS
jgi:hypothetical protein